MPLNINVPAQRTTRYMERTLLSRLAKPMRLWWILLGLRIRNMCLLIRMCSNSSRKYNRNMLF